MRRAALILGLAVCYLTASAIVPERRMLEQGKTWVYTYNHYEENDDPVSGDIFYDHTMWMAYYTLDGDRLVLRPGKTFIALYPDTRIDKLEIN